MKTFKLMFIFLTILAFVRIDFSYAGVVNGDFEAGDLTKWKTCGSVALVDSNIGISPYNGNHMAILSIGNNNIPHSEMITCGTLYERAAPTSILDPTHPNYAFPMGGSIMKQYILAGPGYHNVTFTWAINILKNYELTFPKRSVWGYIGLGTLDRDDVVHDSIITFYYDTASNNMFIDGGGDFKYQSGWIFRDFSLNSDLVLHPSIYVFEVGIESFGDDYIHSDNDFAFLVDSISFRSNNRGGVYDGGNQGGNPPTFGPSR